MEDVLAVYTRPHDPDCPLVCLDETSKQLLAETRLPIPMKPGRPARCDYEYERNGTANLFMMFAAFYALKRKAAPGVDGMTWHDYEADLELRIEDLHGRVHRGAYRPQPSAGATSKSPIAIPPWTTLTS
jgi:hypothetical protein